MMIKGNKFSDLKKKYVLNRCNDIFGLKNVFIWFENERKQKKPDISTWENLLSLILKTDINVRFVDTNEYPGDMLLKIGFSITHYKRLTEKEERLEKLVELHSSVLEVFGDCFLSYENLLFPVYSSSHHVLVLAPGFGLCFIRKTDFLDINIACSALLSWYFLDSYRMGVAKDCLCDWLERVIKEAQEKAKKDFDTAVAVSKDGTKILHADFVLLYDFARGRNVLYSSDVFREQKILLEEHPLCIQNVYRIKNETNLLKLIYGNFELAVKYEVEAQTLFSFITNDGVSKKCFFTYAKKFPEGGIVL